MNARIGQSLPPSTYQYGTTKLPEQQASYKEINASFQNANMQFTTKDGDVVSLAQSNNLVTAYEAFYSHLADTSSFSSSNNQTLSIEGMAFSVEGHLDEQEIADLSRLVSNLADIASDFFTGNYDEAVDGALNLGDMGSIASLEARFAQTTYRYQETAYAGNAKDHQFVRNRHSEYEQRDLEKMLYDQWKNFVKTFLDSDEEEARPPKPEYVSQKNNLKHAEQMMDKITKTVVDYPHYAPYMKSMADHAIDREAEDATNHGQKVSQLAHDLKDQFKELHESWLLS